MKKIISSLSISYLLSACATQIVPEPGKITLEEALQSVGRGLVLMKQAELQQNNNQKFTVGLMPSEAEVTFNISAKGEQTGKLYVELTPVVTQKITSEVGSSSSTSRGNQITIKFKNIAFAKDVLTDPNALPEVLKIIKDSDITTYGSSVRR